MVFWRVIGHMTGKRVYWFKARLGTLCDAFYRIIGNDIMPAIARRIRSRVNGRLMPLSLGMLSTSWSRVDITSNF